jgi:hypothetical protein
MRLCKIPDSERLFISMKPKLALVNLTKKRLEDCLPKENLLNRIVGA